MNRKTWVVRAVLALLICAGLALSAPVFAQQPPAPAPQPKAQQPPEKKDTGKPDEKKPEPPKPGEDKPFDEMVKDMEVIKGVFTFYRKADENKLLMELLPEQMDKLFLFAASVDSSVGERGFYAAQMGGEFPFYFHRVGKSIHWMAKNTNFSAKNGPGERSVARSFPDSLMGAAKIQSKPHPERKSILIDPAELFTSDLPGFGPALSQVYQPTAYRFDKPNSALVNVKGFPENALLDVWLHYVTDNPRSLSITMPDQRSVPILVKYELSTLKETGFKPRLADDRVGQFLTIHQDFSSDKPSTPYVRYINRWQLEKADPTAKLSPPKQPIVFWLENTIPVEYREWVKEGVLIWNKAFERIGYKDAIVVQQQPDNADWDPADTRYSTIRWFAGVDATFAIGPSRANPFTGQIYDADIGLSEGIFRLTRRAAEEYDVPSVSTALEESLPPVSAWFRNQRYQCFYGEGLVQQAQFAVLALDARGALTKEVEEKLLHEYMVETVAHEVGHTLGLRHNFRASTLLKPNELNDAAKTEETGQTASVMDYNPVVVAPKGQKQGHFLTPTLGPYDYWAIEYAYKPIEGDEKAELAKIASRVADPTVPYATDEDALGTISPQAMDPTANQFDQSSDPIAYFRERFGIVNELWGSMDSKLVKPGEGYQVLRRTVNRGMNEYARGLLTTSKFIGGVYFNRDHAGDPNQRPTYVPAAPAKQREALDVLKTYAFSEKAFQLPPGELNRLALDRLPGLDFLAFFTVQRLDYPWHDQVLTVQRLVLTRLYHPLVLSRVLDNELRFAPNEKPFTMADLFKGLDGAIWSELDAPAVKVSSIRRNLQREQMKQLIRLVMRPAPTPSGPGPFGLVIPTPPPPRPPEDATTLARASLVNIQAKIKAALAAGKVTDPTTKAHLEETHSRIATTLQAQTQKPLE